MQIKDNKAPRYVPEVYEECPRIRLETKSGDVVAEFVSPVATSMVPYPGIVLFGQRFFVWNKNITENENVKKVVYREDIVWNLSEFNSEQLEIEKEG